MTNYSENPANHEIIDRLLDRLDYIRIQPETILIVGAQVDYAEKKLQSRYPLATLKPAHDFACIQQIENNSQDLVIAHFALLNAQDPLFLLYEFARVLRDEGLLLLTSLGPDTFFELRESFSKVDGYPHTHAFLDMHHIGDRMKQYHFSDPVVDREEMILAYDDLNLFFTDLKNASMKNNHPQRRRSLMTENQWQKMVSHYAHSKTEDYFPVTLEVIYGHGWKVPLLEDNDDLPAEIAISIDSIKRG